MRSSRARALPWLALFLVVLGARLLMVAHYAPATPMRDAWDAHGAAVLKPWSEGRLTLRDILLPHTDSRLTFSKLIALGLCALNSHWDARVEAAFNALLVAGMLVLVGCAAVRVLGREFRALVLVAVGM